MYSKLIIVLLVQYQIHSAYNLHIKNACPELLQYPSAIVNPNCYYNPDVASTIPEVVPRNGYKLETHSVPTNDGFILTVFRINANATKNFGTPVFLLHGLLMSPDFWCTTGNKSIADRGYDVWLGTFRGTRYSRHKWMPKFLPSFWNYNLDTLAEQDFPAQIQWIHQNTTKKVIVVGHSKGTTVPLMFSAVNSTRANDLIQGVIAMAPIVYLQNISEIQLFQPWAGPLLDLAGGFQIKVFLYPEELIHSIALTVCRVAPFLCYGFEKLKNHIDIRDMLLFWSYFLTPVSVYELKHFLQIQKAEKLVKYNHGWVRNKLLYGTITPPEYKLENIKLPVSLLYGKNDFLTPDANMELLFNSLGSDNKTLTAIPSLATKEYDFGHLDFLYSKDIVQYLFPDLFSVVENIESL